MAAATKRHGLLGTFILSGSKRFFIAALAVILSLAAMSKTSQAVSLYWDLNGAAANTAVPVTGTWDGINVFWNTASTGTGGTPQATTTNADDLTFSSGATYTTGTITLAGAQVANSISFNQNIAVALSSGTSLTIGGGGTNPGIYVLSGDNAANTISTPLILGAGATIQTAGTDVLTISGGVSGAFDLALKNNSTNAAGITLSTSVNNGGLITNSGAGTGGSIISAVIGPLVTGVIQNSSTSSLTLNGAAANAYTGATTVSSGTLAVDFSNFAGATDLINSGSALTLGSGILSVKGYANAGTNTSQSFASTTLNAGAAAILVTQNGGAGTLVKLGAITRTSGVVDFRTSAGVLSPTNGVTTTNAAANNGIIGAWATADNGADWATTIGGGPYNIVAYTGYTTLSGANPTIASNATTNYRVSSASTGGTSMAATGTTDIYTLRINDATARTIDVRNGTTQGILRFGAVGGLLTSGGAHVIGFATAPGTITAGGAANTAGELIVNNAPALTINSVIANNGTGAVALTKAGAGTLTLANLNTYTGTTTILGGTLTTGTSYALPFNTAVALDRGPTLTTANTVYMGSLADLTTNNGGTLAGAGTWIIGTSAGTTTFSGGVTASGTIVKYGGSTQIFNNSTTVNPAIDVNDGTFQLGGGFQVGTSTPTFSTSNFVVSAGATLALDSSTHPVGTFTRTGTVANYGGTISVTGNSANPTLDTLSGVLTVSGGTSSFVVNPGASQTSTLTFSNATFTQSNGGTMFFQGKNLGAAAGPNVAQVIITGLAAASGSGTSIQPLSSGWGLDPAIGATAYGLVINGGANGVRLLTGGEYVTTGGGVVSDSLAAVVNNRLSAATTETLTAPVAVNSLFLNGGGTTISGSALTLSTPSALGGVLLSTGTSANTISAPITFATTNKLAFIHNQNDLALNGALTLSSDYKLRKDGAGTLTLGPGVIFGITTGEVSVNQGKLVLGTANAINMTTGLVRLASGATLDLNGYSQTLGGIAGSGLTNSNDIGYTVASTGLITNNGVSAPVVLNLSVSGTDSYFYGNIKDGTSPIAIVKTGNNTQYVWSTEQPNFSGGLVVNAGAIEFRIPPFVGGAQVPNTTWAIGSSASPIVLNGTTGGVTGVGYENGMFPSTAALGVIIPGMGNYTISNNFTIGANGGAITADTPGGNASITFSGNIALGGNLRVGHPNNFGVGNNTVNGVAPIRYTGTISIDNTAPGSILGVTGYRGIDFAARNNTGSDVELDGNLTQGTVGAGMAANGLLFSSGDWNGKTLYIKGTGNNYTGGTIFTAGANHIFRVETGSSLGTGDVRIMTGVGTGAGLGNIVRLTAAGNVGGIAKVILDGSKGYAAMLSLAGDFVPTIQSTGMGIIAIDTATYTQDPLAAQAAGVFLGSYSGGTITRSLALTPNNGGTTYYLGGGTNTLTINNGILADNGPATGVVAGALAPYRAITGTVYLKGANTYSGVTTINPGMTLQGDALAANSPFGAAAGAVNLNGGSLTLVTQAGTVANVNKGALNIDGYGAVTVNANSNNGILQFGSLNFGVNNSVLNVYVNAAPSATKQLLVTGNIGADNGANGLPALTTAGGGNALPSTILWNTTDFATYGATGFNALNNVTNAEKSTALESDFAAATATSVLRLSGATTLTAAATYNVWGLALAGNTLSSTTATVQLNGGGILGSGNATSTVPIALFNGTNVLASSNTETLSGPISGGGASAKLIKAGSSSFSLSNVANSFTASIVIDSGTLSFSRAGAVDYTLGDVGNSITLNGGELKPDLGGNCTIVASHAITIGPLGGDIYGSGFNTMNIRGPVTGSGPFDVTNQGTMVFDNLTGYTGVFTSRAAATFNGPLGSGATVSNYNVVTFAGTGTAVDGRVSNNATMNVRASTVTIGSLEGFFATGTLPTILVGNYGTDARPDTANDAVLTIGSDNSNSEYWGTFANGNNNAANVLGAGAGYIVKTGSGTLTLYGGGTGTATYGLSGGATVNQGAIKLASLNSLASMPVTVTNTNGLTFATGLGSGNAFSLGALSGADNFALQDTSGAAITLSVGGTNLSRASSGGLTGLGSLVKVGTGIQGLGGTNNFSGSTTINGGTLQATSTTALSATSGVTVATGGNLDFASGSGGTMNVGAGGNAPLSLATGSGIGAEVGGKIKVGAVTATGSPAVKVNVYGSPAVAAPSGSYTLVEASSGLTAGGATYTLGNVYNNTNFTVALGTPTDTTIPVTATPVAALPTAYWTGGLALGNNVWALSNGSTASNWSAAFVGGAAQALVPGPSTNLVLGTGDFVLGADMTVASMSSNFFATLNLNPDGHTLTVNGPIALGSNSNIYIHIPLAGTASLLKISGSPMTLTAANSYTGGTFDTTSLLVADPNAVLGTGNVAVLGGANLRLTAASNISAGAKILAGNNNMSFPVVGLAADLAPSAIGLSASSGGVLAIDAPVRTALNMSTVGNGKMFLGSSLSNSYLATTLTSASDNVYRLGGGGATLTIVNDVLAAGKNLVVGQVNGTLPATLGVINGGGTVKFAANQASFNGTVTVNGGFIGDGYPSTTLEVPILSTGQALGSSSRNVTLNGGNLQFDNGPIRAAAPTMGDLNVNGGPSMLTPIGSANNYLFTINGANGIVRNNYASLFFNNTNAQTDKSLSLFGTSPGTRVFVNNSISGANTNAATYIGNVVPAGNTVAAAAGSGTGMVTYGGNPAPWMNYYCVHGGGDFMTYSAATGFMPTTYSVGNVAGNLSLAAGSQLSNTVPSDLVNIGNPSVTTDSSLTADRTIYALHSFKQTGAVTLMQGGAATTPINLVITSGGLAIDEQNGNFTVGVSDPGTAVAGKMNVVFGSVATPAEGVVWASYYSSATNINLYNGVTATNLTKTGPGNLNLYAPGTNSISGNVTVVGGWIGTGTNVGNNGEFALGSGNKVILNGGGWMVKYEMAANVTHDIVLGASGGFFGLVNDWNGSKNYSGNISDMPAYNPADPTNQQNLPQGASAGPLTLSATGAGNNAHLILTNTSPTANLWTGGTTVVGANGTTSQVIVENSVNFGTGDVNVASGILTLRGNTNLFQGSISPAIPPAKLNVTLGAQANFQSAAPVIGSLDGAGSVVLGTASVATNLTVGTSNADSVWAGVTSETSATKPGAFTKTGTGTMILAGASTYTGKTTLSDGVLNVGGAEIPGTSGPLGKSAASNPGSIEFGGGTLQYSGANTFDYSGRFTTSITQDYKVDTNGQNVTWATALTPLFGGGTLTKSGAGTLTLPAGGNYEGVTTVKGGTLRVTGSIAETDSVNVFSSAVLELANTTGGTALAPSAGYTPVTNNGTMNVSSTNEMAGAISGTGGTNVTGNLTADSIVQNTLSIGAGATVTIRETTGGGAASTVPEPGTWVLIGTALLGWLAFRRRQR
jgi:fibronectin-binding autotransporter adhesin